MSRIYTYNHKTHTSLKNMIHSQKYTQNIIPNTCIQDTNIYWFRTHNNNYYNMRPMDGIFTKTKVILP